MNYADYFHQSINAIKAENRYRTFRPLQRNARFPKSRCGDQEIISWCGVDYLGLTQNLHIKQAAIDSIHEYGTGAGGTRNIGGTHLQHAELEARLAVLHRHEAALLFTSGYVANQTTLATLGKILPDLVYLSDAENHMSIIDGMRASGAQKIIFEHNNMQDLENILAKLPLDRPKIIVFETVYSMSGDFPPMAEIVALARKYNAMTYADEVHALGVYGGQGGGLIEAFGMSGQIDIVQGTLGKGFGLLGGYIAASAEIIDSIRLMGSGFIFTVSLPPHLCATAIAVLDYLQTHREEQAQLAELVQYLKASLHQAGLPIVPSAGQIIPILIGDPILCQRIAERLFNEYHIYVQAVNYPTVRKGQERLRISPTALHTFEQADQLVEALTAVFCQEAVKPCV